MTLSPAFLDELRSRTLLSALIGRTVKLTKAGREFKGCCPVHNEKTPSFTVNDEKGFGHCFGCGFHCDAIGWLTDTQGMPFMEAVRMLADGAGMEVPAASPEASARAARIEGVRPTLEAAQEFYARELTRTGAAMEYLTGRGIGPDLVAAFGLGFAPARAGHLRDTGCSRTPLIASGLCYLRDDDTLAERFRRRIMVPVHDARGRIVSFGGRDFDVGRSGENRAKYINGPETELFDKGRTLFNWHRAAAAFRGEGRMIVVEGYMDVIALAGAGIHCVVAPMGTALTEAQLERIWRLTDCPVIAFDGDAAGQKAAVRAAETALPFAGTRGQSLGFARLPAGQDPDDVVRNEGGGDAFRALIDEAAPLNVFLFDEVMA